MEPSPGKVLLDVGCGRGDDVRALAGRVAPTGRVFGIDRSATLIHEARGAGPVPGADFEVADAQLLPFDDRRFAMVSASLRSLTAATCTTNPSPAGSFTGADFGGFGAGLFGA
jgi:ubiquinone/menaquinone biosynthesis C-methylase UbiE